MTPRKDWTLNLAGQFSADYHDTHDTAMIVIETLSDEHIEVGHGLVGTALAFVRLANYGTDLGKEKEIQAVQDLMDWATAYFADTGGVQH